MYFKRKFVYVNIDSEYRLLDEVSKISILIQILLGQNDNSFANLIDSSVIY